MTVKLSDPLKEKILPKSFQNLGLTHHSPTQASLPDGVHFFKYAVLNSTRKKIFAIKRTNESRRFS